MCQLLAKQVLVANIQPQALALPVEGRLVQTAPVEVAQRDVHEPNKPLRKRWDELAKGYEVVFVVLVRRGHGRVAGQRRLEGHDRVAVTVVSVPHRNADQRRLLVHGKTLAELQPIVRRQLLW